MDARGGAPETLVNVLAFSTPPTSDWRWRIVASGGEIVEESSMSFPTIAHATAAGTERLQFHRDRDRPPPARAPWRRRR
jgi:hypothetical protein